MYFLTCSAHVATFSYTCDTWCLHQPSITTSAPAERRGDPHSVRRWREESGYSPLPRRHPHENDTPFRRSDQSLRVWAGFDGSTTGPGRWHRAKGASRGHGVTSHPTIGDSPGPGEHYATRMSSDLGPRALHRGATLGYDTIHPLPPQGPGTGAPRKTNRYAHSPTTGYTAAGHAHGTYFHPHLPLDRGVSRSVRCFICYGQQ